MTQRSVKFSSERRSVSALPWQRETGGCSSSGDLAQLRAGLSSAGTERSLTLSCSSEMFQRWLSRPSSALSIRSNGSSCLSSGGGTCSAAERRQKCHNGCGRQNRASVLRVKSCSSIRSDQPIRDYQEAIKRRREFTHRCKSQSASNVRCKTLPDGEPLHAFITGARYNRAHNLDSHSLERVGVYIPRSDATRSFVNPVGSRTTSTHDEEKPEPQVTQGRPNSSLSSQSKLTNSKSGENKSNRKSSRSHRRSESAKDSIGRLNVPHYHRQHSSLVIRSYHSNQAWDEAAAEGANCVVKPLIQHHATSREISNKANPSPSTIEVALTAKTQDRKECATSKKEELHANDIPDVASTNSSRLLISGDHKRVNIGESNSPQHSVVGPPTANEGGKHSDESGVQCQQQAISSAAREGGEVEFDRTANTDDTVAEGANVEESSEDELISPEARALITDEILKECQQSSSSFASSSNVSHDSINRDNTIDDIMDIPLPSRGERLPQATPTLEPGHNDQQLACNSTSKSRLQQQSSEDMSAISDQQLQAGGSCELTSAKSSAIFVDMSNLRLDQVQLDDDADLSSNN